MRSLLECGVNPNTYHRRCQTALHHAVMIAENEDIVQLLIEFGANINAKTADFKLYHFTYFCGPGSTPLHIAVDFGTSHTVHRLLLAGSKPNERNQNEAMPLDIAAQRYVNALDKVYMANANFKRTLAKDRAVKHWKNIHLILSAGGILSDVSLFQQHKLIQQKFQAYLVHFEQWDILNNLWSSGFKFYTEMKGGIDGMYLETVGIDKAQFMYIIEVLNGYNQCPLSLFQIAANKTRQSLNNNVWYGVKKLNETVQLPSYITKQIVFSNQSIQCGS